jgi:Kdo2-lipid IVA lauroyltransferase/acyltransferase
MNKPLGYYLLLVATWPMHFFPLRFHYLFSYFFYLLIYKTFGYRKKVVAKNLLHAFPEKTAQERKKIEKAFYLGFTDMFIETLYLTHASYNTVSKNLKIENLDEVEDFIAQGRNTIFMAGHLGNWEYFQLFREDLGVEKYFIYKRLGNRSFDLFYKRLRSMAGDPLEMAETYRKLIAASVTPKGFLACSISDQRPYKSELFHWLTFLNQDTPVITGTEKIARKTNAVVFYAEMTKIKRGKQKLHFKLITDKPRDLKPMELTRMFFEKLEESVRTNPSQYFWTHNRWKYSKNEKLTHSQGLS